MAGQQAPTEITVSGAQPGRPFPWIASNNGPSFVGWPAAPEGYLSPFQPILDYPALNSTQELCATVAISQCSSISCLNGVSFGAAPYVADQTARLALDAGAPEFSKGVELYGSCVRAVMGGVTPSRNIYL